VRALASRQRVYLADATAVQYTRDPVAVRDLLRRIDSERRAARLVGPYKEEFGPMLFVPGVKRLCLRTHPKLRQRIARLETP
jgi:Zn-dependent protease with chaperone function